MVFNRRQLLSNAGGAVSTSLFAGSLVPGLLTGKIALAENHSKVGIGMNLAGFGDFAPGFPFLNLMWGARIWLTRLTKGSGPWDTGLAGDIQTDPDGYPLELPYLTPDAGEAHEVFTLLPNTLSRGAYVVLYDGEGEIGTGIATRLVSQAPGRAVVFMQHSDAAEVLAIRKSKRGNHVRNIRVLPLALEAANLNHNPFRTEFIDFCKPWQCLRFMDWQATNNSINQAWDQRPKTSFYTQVGITGDRSGSLVPSVPAWQLKWGSGVALEVCIQLANLTKTDAWLCVPHLADDDYIRQMAKLVKNTLDPNLRVYIEYSNEIWNWQFLQSQWMLRSELAGDLVALKVKNQPWPGGVKPTGFVDGVVQNGSPAGVDHPERIGALFSRCFRIFEQEFAGAARNRLVLVCSVQAVWHDTINRTLNWVMGAGGCDALSPAGYFGPNERIYARWQAAGSALTIDQVVNDMREAIGDARKDVEFNARAAQKAGIRLVVYEGGQHIQPEGQIDRPYNSTLKAAQHHPAMYDLYRENLDLYGRGGCDLYCAYSSVSAQGTRWGSWGHVERYGQPPIDAPKYRALLEANMERR